MILVDTSVWVDHIRHSESRLVKLLYDGQVLSHAFVIEELACGNLPKRVEFLDLMESLPRAPIAEHHEVLDLIANERLHGTGLGAVDVHLIASAVLGNAAIWSKDKALSRVADKLGLG